MTRRTLVKYTQLSFPALTALVAVLAFAGESRADIPKLGCALNGITPAFGENYGPYYTAGWKVIEGDPLQIASGPYGEIGVWVCQPNENYPVGQYYSDTDWASVVHFTPYNGAPVIYGAPNAYDDSYVSLFTPISQTTEDTGNEHKIINVVGLGSEIELTRIVTYVEGSYSYKLHWELKNVSGVSLTNLHFFHGGDTMFGGDDSARSWWNGELNRVYVSNEDFSYSGTMAFSGTNATPASHYFGGHYSDGEDYAMDGLLPDTTDSQYMDAGYQLQWDRAQLASGQIWTIEASESWSDPSFITVLAPNQRLVTPGSTVRMEFVVHNLDTQAHAFLINEAVTGNGWSATAYVGGSIFLEALESQVVEMDVFVPDDAVAGSLERVSLTATEETLVIESSSATDLEVFDPEYTLSPPLALDFPWTIVNETLTLTLTFNNAGSAVEIGDLATLSGVTAPFSLGDTTCSNQTIPTGESCTIDIVYTPSSEGEFFGNLAIPLLAPLVNTENIVLHGRAGITPACDDGFLNGDETDEDCGGSCGSTCDEGEACLLNSDCVYDACDNHVCLPEPTCHDGIANGAESDIDCGGGSCNPCLNGMICTVDYDCYGYNCLDGVCTATPECNDGVTNGDETDQDCGGSCAPCYNGLACQANYDCYSYNCYADVCQPYVLPPSCYDGVTNGDETDQDCGGSCYQCGYGQACLVDSDCYYNNCDSNVCIPVPPACDDGMWNGDETGQDCGGSCGTCANGIHCYVDGDCDSTNCVAQVCEPLAATCSDSQTNGDETDEDCGGSCGACTNGKTCAVDGDCDSSNCASNVCEPVPANCDDSALNGDETDVDCGGSCGACANGKACSVDGDCDSTNCASDICAAAPVAPACDDAAMNGDETDVDCGGSCEPCSLGQACEESSDCRSTRCKDNVCEAVVAATCDDDKKNGDETDVDCGGSCSSCATGSQCDVNADCHSARCIDNACEAVASITCGDETKNGDETDVDCGGSCGACAAGKDCQANTDCVSSTCTDDVCSAVVAPSCEDGKKNGDETDVDCGGSCDEACANGDRCEASSDCDSSRCKNNVCTAAASPGTCSDGKKNGTETDVDCGGDCSPCAEVCEPEDIGLSGGGAGCSLSATPSSDRSGLALLVAALGATLVRRRRPRVNP